MDDAVLVTGAFGLVGTATLAHMGAGGRRIMATPRHRQGDIGAAMVAAMGLVGALPTGWKRYPLRLMTPLAREFLKRHSPYYRQPGRYANPWEAVRNRWGAPEADRRTP